MSQPPDIIPTGKVQDKYHPEKYERDSKRRMPLEMILVALVFLFLILVLALLVYNSMLSIDTANKYLPTVAAPTK